MSRYEINIGNVKKTVDIERVASSNQQEEYKLQLIGEDKAPIELVVLKRRHGSLVLSLDEKVYSVTQMKRSSNAVEYLSNGRSVLAYRPGTTSNADQNARSSLATINELVTSNFPAKVVSIKVSNGVKLKEGDTLLILEAMKMEAQIKAPRDCRVVGIFVKEGDMIPRGAKLAQLKFDQISLKRRIAPCLKN